jgi:hypothetical protein
VPLGRVAELLATAALGATGMLVVGRSVASSSCQKAFTKVDAEVELLETVQLVAGNAIQVSSCCKQ